MTLRNDTIAKDFSLGIGLESKSKNKHLFIEGNTIYSYGRHFPISKRLFLKGKEFYLFNTERYSVTTARHKSLVLSYLPKNRIIFLSGCDVLKAKEQYQENIKEIDDFKEKLKKVRTEQIKENYQEQIKNLLIQNDLLLNSFDLIEKEL